MNPIVCAALPIALSLLAQTPAPSGSADRATSSRFTLWQLPAQTRTQIMSYVIRSANGRLIVIDGGVDGDAPYLKQFLVRLGGKVEAWFLTHPHADHVNAFVKILRNPGSIEIKTIYASLPTEAWTRKHANVLEVATLTKLLKALQASRRTVTDLTLGQELRIDGIRMTVLGVKNPEIHPNPINNSSIVVRMVDGKKSVLFLADLGVEGGEKLLRSTYRSQLPSDYVQMAHHGQNGVSERFYQVVSPSYCLWPTPRWLWDNDSGQGKGSGPWRTLDVRAWMDKLHIKRHYVMADGLYRID